MAAKAVTKHLQTIQQESDRAARAATAIQRLLKLRPDIDVSSRHTGQLAKIITKFAETMVALDVETRINNRIAVDL